MTLHQTPTDPDVLLCDPAQLDFLTRTLRAGTWRYDRDTTLFVMSAEAARILGCAGDDGVEAMLSRLAQPDRETISAALAGGHDGDRVVELTSGDWRRLAWEVNGPTVRGVVSVSDSPTRQGSRTQLVGDRFVELMGMLPFASAVFDRDMVPVFVNPLAESLVTEDSETGKSRLLLYQAGTDRLCSADDLPVRKVFKTRRAASVSDIEKIASSGRRVPQVVWAKPFATDEDGRVEQVIAVFLSSDHQSLSKQLQQVRMEAENAARAKSRFLANISHELRTPLTAILGFLQLTAQSGEVGKRQVRNIELAMESGMKLQSLIDNILEIAQIEANELILDEADFDLREMIATIDASYAPLAELKGLRFVTRVDDSLSVIRTDREKIRQMLVVLVDNAVKFTNHGSVKLHAFREGRLLVIEVVDTGKGISDDRKNRLFEPFQDQLDYQSEYGQAIGLGLPICKSYVSLMHGSLTVESEQARGTTFRIALPVLGGDEAPPVAPSPGSDEFEPDFEDDFEDDMGEGDWECLAEAVGSLDVMVRDALRNAILKADPGSFRKLLSASELPEQFAHQVEYLVNTYQYDDVLSLLAADERTG
ncbi:MAG: HAMP domain-containing histidine kinase [Pseudomonadales bacterium]|nr:HAMP domain-containing histidine kinase [Pseudomonadales bacterium]